MILPRDLDNWFTYHAPDDDDIDAYNKMRTGAKALATIILANTPASPDQTASIRKLRECIMTANAARACHPKQDPTWIQT